MRVTATLMVLCAKAALAQSPWPHCEGPEESLEDAARALLCVIGQLSDYRSPHAGVPALKQIPQAQLEAKLCDAPCDVSAAYLPRERTVYLAGNLNPLRDVFDRSALLHELVHHLQQGHAKYAHLTGCARERAKEEEAYTLQNAYLGALNDRRRAVFYAGAFPC